MHGSTPPYEIYAIRYGAMDRLRREDVIGDPHDGPKPMDFFDWLLRSPQRTVLVDSGYGAAVSNAAPLPCIKLILVGGYAKGLQAVRVHTVRGWAVLSSDASHCYDMRKSCQWHFNLP